MYLPAANSVALSTNSSVRFRVDASGNAGLGVTPAAHGSSERALDIGNTTSFGRQSDAALVVNFNTFLNASSQYVYRISSFASSYQQLAGEHKFFTAPSGTAGNTVTLTQRMTITQSGDITANTGNLVIGTAGKGVTDSTGAVTLNFSSTAATLNSPLAQTGTINTLTNDFSARTASMALNDTLTISNLTTGVIEISEMNFFSNIAVIAVSGAATAIVYRSDLATTITAGNPGTLNVYRSGANVIIENKNAATLQVRTNIRKLG
jgi:hypothetical protein